LDRWDFAGLRRCALGEYDEESKFEQYVVRRRWRYNATLKQFIRRRYQNRKLKPSDDDPIKTRGFVMTQSLVKGIA
jgi:hypothetical protein